MLLENDTSVYSIDSRFLGPKGQSLPFEARYISWPLGFGVLIMCIAIERQLGIGIGLSSVAVTLLITVAITSEIMRRVDAERPVRAVFQTLWNEINTPRAPQSIAIEIRIPKVQRKAGTL